MKIISIPEIPEIFQREKKFEHIYHYFYIPITPEHLLELLVQVS